MNSAKVAELRLLFRPSTAPGNTIGEHADNSNNMEQTHPRRWRRRLDDTDNDVDTDTDTDTDNDNDNVVDENLDQHRGHHHDGKRRRCCTTSTKPIQSRTQV